MQQHERMRQNLATSHYAERQDGLPGEDKYKYMAPEAEGQWQWDRDGTRGADSFPSHPYNEDAGHEVGDELHKQEQLNNNGDNLKDNASDNRGINELLQLLQKKTFSRDEFDKLTELLRSRTVDLSANVEMKSSADDGKKRAESSQKGKEMAGSVLENGIESSGLRGSISKLTSGSSVPVEAALPAELAKAFMGARSSRISPSTSSLRNRSFQEDISLVNITPSNPSKSADMSFALTSANIFSKNGNLTPSLRGRSAIYNMARSPYARAQSTAVPKNTKPAEDSFVGPPTSYQWMHAHSMLLGGRQATENGNNRLSASNSDSVPPQSSDMAKKILQELDKLVASPKPKSSELKLALAREKSPGKLTTNMLNTRALKSMEVIESPKQGTDGAHLSDSENISKQTRDRVEDNGTSKTSDVGSKIAKVHDIINAVTSVQDTVTSTWAVDSTIKGPAVCTPQVKRAFQMTAPEIPPLLTVADQGAHGHIYVRDSLELDDDGYIFGTATSAPLPTEKEKLQNFLLEPKVVAEAVVHSSESIKPAAYSIFTFGSSSPSTSAGFSFGMSTASAGNGHLPFGAASATTSSGPSMFSCTLAATATSSSSLSPAQPVFQMSNAPITFGSPFPSNDQMGVEDSMAEDTIHSSNTPASSFGQLANTLSASNFVFGSPAVQSVGSQPFQFGGQQNPMIPQNPSPFSAPGGNLELQPGGSLSLGTGGDMSNRKFIRARRGEKGRRK